MVASTPGLRGLPGFVSAGEYLAEFGLSPCDLPLYPARGSSEMAVKKSWTGPLYEDFEVGDVYEHPLGRTVLAADNTWFTLLTMNTQPLHFDHHYASKTGFGKPLVNSCLTLAIVTGQSVMDLSQNVFANLGWDESDYPIPSTRGIRFTQGARSSRCANPGRARM